MLKKEIQFSTLDIKSLILNEERKGYKNNKLKNLDSNTKNIDKKESVFDKEIFFKEMKKFYKKFPKHIKSFRIVREDKKNNIFYQINITQDIITYEEKHCENAR